MGAMEEARGKRNELAAQRVIKGLESRHMEGYYAATKEEALKLALSLIPEGSTIGSGGSYTSHQIGLIEAIRKGNYNFLDRETVEDREERMEVSRQCLLSDVFIMGSNAITEDGQLVNLDGIGNRVAALCFGPKSVIVVVGMNKLTKTLDEAVARVRNTAAPINAFRFPGDTPCREHGICGDCKKDSCICCQLVITRGSMTPGRVKVILIGEALGY